MKLNKNIQKRLVKMNKEQKVVFEFMWNDEFFRETFPTIVKEGQLRVLNNLIDLNKMKYAIIGKLSLSKLKEAKKKSLQPNFILGSVNVEIK